MVGLMLAYSHDELQSLVPGYALGILDENEKIALENHLPSCAGCRSELTAFSGPVDELPWAVEPLPLPKGHLDRFRAKALGSLKEPENPGENLNSTSKTFREGLSETAKTGPLELKPESPPEPVKFPVEKHPEAESEFERALRRKRAGISGRASASGIAFAAAFALFVVAGLLAFLVLDTNNHLSKVESNNRLVASLLSSQNVKVTELKSNSSDSRAAAVVLFDPGSNRSVLVSENLPALPDDKSYQVWVIGPEGKPQSAGVFNRDKEQPSVVELSPPGNLDQYKRMAITVEPRGGSPGGPTTRPVSTGNLG